jgi:hypothetical protein
VRGAGKAGCAKARRGGREARAAVGGYDTAEELLAGAELGCDLEEAGEDGLHGREEARGGELGDDDVVAAERVSERGRWCGVHRRGKEEAERGTRVRLPAEGGDEVVGREFLGGHGGSLHFAAFSVEMDLFFFDSAGHHSPTCHTRRARRCSRSAFLSHAARS